MIGKICDNILTQINQASNAEDIKRALMFRLEIESGPRGVIRDVPQTPDVDVHDFTGGEPTPEPQTKTESPEVDSGDADAHV